MLVLVGPSGSGKSSLLRAGLAASLAEDGVRCTIVPTGASEDELLTEIEDGDAGSVLVLDQVEEVVARLASPAQRARLADALVACAARRRLALAIRADRFGDLAELPGFAGLAERGLVLLGPLGEEALREVIEGPAREAALLLEPGLVDVLLQDVRDDPGALPLLSHALRETWERREGRTLTVEGYRASGGISGAVARSAEQVYDGLPDDDRDQLRGLMLRLLTLAPDGEPLRSAVPREAIPADAAHEHLVERLVQARLVTGRCRRRSTWRTRPSPAPGRGCAAGSTTTSRVSASCATSAPRPRAGTRWDVPTPSSTGETGWRGRPPGRPLPAAT